MSSVLAPPRPVAPAPAAPPAAPPRRLPRRLILFAIFAAAALYHGLWSFAHASPAIFSDELLYGKLAQGIAAGHGLVIRGEHVFFPAPLAAVAQAPAWLVGGVGDSYTAAKLLNAVLMASAAFPAYAIARRLAGERLALLGAAAAVLAPAMVYHSYLLSEALAYPVFLVAVATYLRELAEPSPRLGLAVLGVSLLAVGTRAQFAALPLAYLAGLAATRSGGVRRHAVPLAGLGLLAGAWLLTGGAGAGPYLGATLADYDIGSVAHWAVLTGALVPFEAGFALLPAAVLGLGLLLRSRRPAERGFAVIALVLAALFLLQAGLVADLQAGRPLERYAVYLAPLLVAAALAYASRGAAWTRAYVALAVALAVSVWLMPFSSTADYRFSFDSPVLSAFGMLAAWSGVANAATVFAAVPALAVAAATALRRRRVVPIVISLALMAAAGGLAYAGDRSMTRSERRAFAPADPSWLDHSGLGRADVLALPGASRHTGWMVEAWNRDSGRMLELWVPAPPDSGLPVVRAQVRRDGVLLEDGKPLRPGLLVLADGGTRLELEGTVLARPRPGLTLVRTPAGPHVRSAAVGLFADGWAAPRLRYRIWPEGKPGTFVVALSLPAGSRARTVTLRSGITERRLRLVPGGHVQAELPAAGELELTSDRVDEVGVRTPDPRLVSVRVDGLAFVAT
jgi:hypothetical protein